MDTDNVNAAVAMVTVDCPDPVVEARFWAAFLSGHIAAATEDYGMVVWPDEPGRPALGFGRVDDFEPPAWPNEHGSKQFHLDLAVNDIAAAESRAVELGACRADPQPGETWVVLLDPAGHPFCLTDAKNWG